MQRKIIPDHLAVLHHESNSLQLATIRDWISCNGNDISKFPGLNRTHAVLPARHFRGIDGDGANNVERRHSSVTQINERRNACLAARLSGDRTSTYPIQPQISAPTSTLAEPDRRIVFGRVIGAGIRSVEGGGHHNAGLSDLPVKAAIKSGRQVEEDAFIAHLLQLLVAQMRGHFYHVITSLPCSIESAPASMAV